MLLPSPEIQKRLDTYQTIDALEAKLLKFEWRRQNRRRGAITRIFAGLALISAGISAYSQDVHANQLTQAEAIIDVQVKGDALDPENNNKAIVFLDGFRTVNGDVIAKYRGEGLQQVLDGQLWSVGYNDAHLEPKVISDRIADLAEEKGVDTVYIYGESAGGSVEMQVQEELIKNANITVAANVLNSVPDGVEGLQQARQEEIGIVQILSKIPGAKYSSLVRFIGEMAFQSDSFMSDKGVDIPKAISTGSRVTKLIENNKIAGSWLMVDQAISVETGDIEGHIKTISELPDHVQRPVIVYISTDDPKKDTVVNVEVSGENIKSYADAANIPFIWLKVPGAVHARPELDVEEFNATLKDAQTEIDDAIMTQTQIAVQNRYAARQYRP